MPIVLQCSPCLARSPFAVPPAPECLEDLEFYCTHTSAFKCLTCLFLSRLHGPECQGLQEQKDRHQEMWKPVGPIWPHEPCVPRSQCSAGCIPVSMHLSLGESTQASGHPSTSPSLHPPLSFPETRGNEEQQKKTQVFGVTTPWSSPVTDGNRQDVNSGQAARRARSDDCVKN